MIVHVDTSFSLVVLVNPRDLAREEDPHVLLHFLGPSFNYSPDSLISMFVVPVVLASTTCNVVTT